MRLEACIRELRGMPGEQRLTALATARFLGKSCRGYTVHRRAVRADDVRRLSHENIYQDTGSQILGRVEQTQEQHQDGCYSGDSLPN